LAQSASRSTATRRRFLQIAALTGIASAASADMLSWAQGRSRPATPRARAPEAKAPADTTRAAAPAPPSEDAVALAGIVERRYGKHLAPKQLEAVTRELENRLQAGKRLREAALVNADEPDFVFGIE
jgi:hypothetical protein